MRSVILMIVLATLLVAHPAIGQEPQTLVKNGASHGGFGGPVMRVTSMNGQFGVLLGGHGGWIIDHRFIIGGGAYGLLNDMVNVSYAGLPTGQPYLTFGYGGVELQYVVQPMKLVHYWIWALVGGGNARFRQGSAWITENDGVFVAEPGGGITVNLTRSIRIDAGASYRFVNGMNTAGMSNGDVSGPSGTLAVSFGHF